MNVTHIAWHDPAHILPTQDPTLSNYNDHETRSHLLLIEINHSPAWLTGTYRIDTEGEVDRWVLTGPDGYVIPTKQITRWAYLTKLYL